MMGIRVACAVGADSIKIHEYSKTFSSNRLAAVDFLHCLSAYVKVH
jgi:hypothetical protein